MAERSGPLAAEHPVAASDDFLLEEHSGESGGDEAASGLEMDAFQAVEIRQIFLTTLPEYLEPVSQMLEQVLSVAAGHEEVRRALQTTLSSISTAASRVGIHDVCNAVELMRDQLLTLDDEPTPPSAGTQRMLRDAFATLEALAGGGQKRAGGPPTQTIVAALQHVEGIDKSVLERLTAAGLVTVDQLRIADAGEVVAVTGLDAAVVKRLLEILLRPSNDDLTALVEDAEGLFSETPVVAEELAEKLRAQVDVEASLDELRAEILRARLAIATCKERVAAAEHRRDRLQTQLLGTQALLTDELSRLTAARLLQAKLERERAAKRQALSEATRRLTNLQSEHQTIVATREQLAEAISGLVAKLEQVNRVAHVPEPEHSVGERSTVLTSR